MVESFSLNRYRRCVTLRVGSPQEGWKGNADVKLAGQSASVPVSVSGFNAPMHADFIHDVAPVLSRLGCNQGTCHGSAQGKNGFKLSLRGYDPLFDVRALTDDHAGRHINLASPDDSMMLTKPTGAVPHVGGALIQVRRALLRNPPSVDQAMAPSSIFHRNASARSRSSQSIPSCSESAPSFSFALWQLTPRERSVTLLVKLSWRAPMPRLQSPAAQGLMTAIRRGEAPVLARFEGSYASTTITVMGDRSGFVWTDPPTFSRIDELVAVKWKRMKILPSEVAE